MQYGTAQDFRNEASKLSRKAKQFVPGDLKDAHQAASDAHNKAADAIDKAHKAARKAEAFD